ncbi:energy transducer TonB [Bacillus subtilis subsp. subtilis]|nr:energy transducer TonB [Bacillus subtilis subsp. subtilis]
MSAGRAGYARWAGSLGIVLATYAICIAATLWWLGRSPPLLASAPPQALMVELAPVAEAPPAPATDIAQGPPQQEQHRAEPEPEPQPVRAFALPPQPHPDGEAQAQHRLPPREQTPSDDHNVEQTLAPPDVQATPGPRYAAPQTTAGQRSNAPITWQGLLLGHLEQHRRYPRSAERLRQQGVVYVRFAVDRQGNASHIRIGQSSGHPLLDAETLDTVRRGSPVPAPPPEIGGDPVEVMVPVAFFIGRH